MIDQTRAEDTLRLIRCSIADETYGLDMSWVRSIQRTDRLRRNPEAEGPVGWLPASEGDVPVFSLASRLGRLSGKSSAQERIIILNTEPRAWGLLVDRVSRVIRIPTDRVVSLPQIVVGPSANYFEGVIRLDEELILFLSPEQLHPDAAPKTDAPAKQIDVATPDFGTSLPTKDVERQRRSLGRIIVFSIAEPFPGKQPLSFGLSISQVPEILASLPTIPVPGAPAFVLGLANWRDRPLPVIDLAERLKLTPSSSTNGSGRVIIARGAGVSGEDVLIGFPIRPAIRVLRLPIAHQPSSRVLPLDPALIRGIVELEDETLVIPDMRGFFRRE